MSYSLKKFMQKQLQDIVLCSIFISVKAS